MRHLAGVSVALLAVSGLGFAKVHRDVYPVGCSALWPAVKDTLPNLGKYGIMEWIAPR
jgi:hypothetical protein